MRYPILTIIFIMAIAAIWFSIGYTACERKYLRKELNSLIENARAIESIKMEIIDYVKANNYGIFINSVEEVANIAEEYNKGVKQ